MLRIVEHAAMPRIQHGRVHHAKWRFLFVVVLHGRPAQVRLAVVLHHFEGGGHDVSFCEETDTELLSVNPVDAPKLQAPACQRLGVELLGLLVQREKQLVHVVAVD